MPRMMRAQPKPAKKAKSAKKTSYIYNVTKSTSVKHPRSAPTSSFSRFIIPDYTLVMLPFQHYALFSSSGATMGSNIYRGSSIYDPNYTGAGTTVMGYSQWANFYSRYRVYSSEITVKARQVTPTTGMCMLIVGARNDVSADTIYSDAVGDPYTKNSILPLVSTSDRFLIKSKMSTRKILGLTKAQSQDDDYSAAFGANPSKNWYWHVGVQAMDATTASTIQVYVTINYKCKLSDRLDLDY